MSRKGSSRAWKILCLAAGVWLTTFAFLTFHPVRSHHWTAIATSEIYDVAGVTATAALFLAAKRLRRARSALVFMALAFLCNSLGDVFYSYSLLAVHHGGEVPFPSTSDWLYLAYYPLALIGTSRLIRLHSFGRRDTIASLDAAIAGISLFAVFWYMIGSPLIAVHDTALIDLAAGIAQPAGAFAVLAMMVVLEFRSRVGVLPAVRLILVALALWAVGDAGYAYVQLHSTYDFGTQLDLTWLAAYLLIVVAAVHPSLSRLDASGRIPPPRKVSRGRGSALAIVASIPACLALSAALASGSASMTGGLIALSVIVFLVVLRRMSESTRSSDRLLAELARHDIELEARLVELNAIVEDDRVRRLQAVYDEILQSASALGYDLDLVASQLERGASDSGVVTTTRARRRLEETILGIRRLAMDLESDDRPNALPIAGPLAVDDDDREDAHPHGGRATSS